MLTFTFLYSYLICLPFSFSLHPVVESAQLSRTPNPTWSAPVTVCPRGYYGEMCARACFQCEYCHFETGQCLCDLGRFGETCGSICPDGRFGDGCSQTCDCKNGATCTPSTGTCQCYAGFIGPDCSLMNGDHSLTKVSTLISNCREIWIPIPPLPPLRGLIDQTPGKLDQKLRQRSV
ncbi:Multiple epidermal growth factor domains protein 6 [Fasciola gigantica]|uniref:Multiple epidermal growth factor domains protein 6 n=1 Tax=Fasciola gigantica TaxID=46835 RepID=A0A504YB61_FASGI|nr:Multiple epidermal growth factor domains protein 6 [Fasciola gigantica]